MTAFVNHRPGPIYVGMSPSSYCQFRPTWKTTESIQCDGDELTLALDILGRTNMSRRVFTFIGDEAKTIVANWR